MDKTRRSAASPDSPTSPARSASKGVDEAPAPQATARPRMQGPLAVKSKVAKPAEYPQGRDTEQGMSLISAESTFGHCREYRI